MKVEVLFLCRVLERQGTFRANCMHKLPGIFIYYLLVHETSKYVVNLSLIGAKESRKFKNKQLCKMHNLYGKILVGLSH